MKTLYFDCSMGAAGDMLTAALLELHPEPERFLDKINAALGGRALISAERAEKCGVFCTRVSVRINGDEEGEELHHHHGHTSLAELEACIDGMSLPEKVRQDGRRVFALIAGAESRVHGAPVENIHLHEVGSLDALADVMAVCLLLHELAPEKILASPVRVGGGMVRCAHGLLPVPAPATELLLRDVPIYAGNIMAELCTPTGAALLKYFAEDFVPLPLMRLENCGRGAGKKDFEAANILRALLGETEEKPADLLELSCNLDDMSPEEMGFAMEELFALGALDVYFTPIGMKKSRPGIMLSCLCRPEMREEALRCIFKNTSTLGVREYACQRAALRRSFRCVETEHGSLRLKTAEGYGVCREKPEYDDLARIARAASISLREAAKYAQASSTPAD